MTVQSWEYFFLLYRRILASYCFDIQMWDLQNPTLFFWVPWNLLYKEQCFTGNHVMCVIARNEGSVGGASLCPLIPLINLCGGLAAWILIVSFDKGTHMIIDSYISMFGLKNSNELRDIQSASLYFYANICWAHTHPYTWPQAWWAVDIMIKTWILLFLNRNVAGNKKLKNLK